jgi:hypothetical protein
MASGSQNLPARFDEVTAALFVHDGPRMSEEFGAALVKELCRRKAS